MSRSLRVVPVTLGDARAYVERHHSHHHAPVGGLFAAAVADGDRMCCVAIVSRPVARAFDFRTVAEITRVASDGTRHAASMCIAAATRAALALGYRRVISYTIIGETGASYLAAGWHIATICEFSPWNHRGRTRATAIIESNKVRWETGPDALPANGAAALVCGLAAGRVAIPSRPENLPLLARVS